MDSTVLIAAQQHQKLSAATGVTGAGTQLGAGPATRAWGEFGFTSQEDDGTALWLLAGAGVRLGSALELEAILPIGYWGGDNGDVLIGNVGASPGQSSASQGAWVGNPYLGANLLLAPGAALRIRVGAGIALPVVGNDGAGSLVKALPIVGAGFQDPEFWLPEAVSVVLRGRVEVDLEQGLVLAADLATIGAVPTWQPVSDLAELHRPIVVYLQPAAEIGCFTQPDTLVGLRIPVSLATAVDTDPHVSLVPFVEQRLGDGFVGVRLTLNASPLLLAAQLGGGIAF